VDLCSLVRHVRVHQPSSSRSENFSHPAFFFPVGGGKEPNPIPGPGSVGVATTGVSSNAVPNGMVLRFVL
jgi:hypothetical protein